MSRLELNADIGEGWDDAGLMPFLDRAAIACGGHIGDVASMNAALALCAEHGVIPGAHPSYPDREHFGRRVLAAPPADIHAWVAQQTEALLEVAARRGQTLAHVKPHGMLYNVAARDPETAAAVAEAVATLDRSLVLIGLAGSHLLAAGRAAGLAVMGEAFADRAYAVDGSLVSRGTPGALLEAPEAAATQAAAIARARPVAAHGGGTLTIHAETLCLHSDTPGALHIARAVHAAIRG